MGKTVSTLRVFLVIICISVTLTSLTLVYVYMEPHDHEQENPPHEQENPPLSEDTIFYDFNYTVKVNIDTPTKSEFYLIVPFPLSDEREVPVPSVPSVDIKDGLYIANGSGSFFINDSVYINSTYYNLIGLQINTSGNIMIESSGSAPYAFIDHMSMAGPGNSSYFRNYSGFDKYWIYSRKYWIYSSFHGNLTIYIYAKSSRDPTFGTHEFEAEISGNVTYGWNLVNGVEWEGGSLRSNTPWQLDAVNGGGMGGSRLK